MPRFGAEKLSLGTRTQGNEQCLPALCWGRGQGVATGVFVLVSVLAGFASASATCLLECIGAGQRRSCLRALKSLQGLQAARRFDSVNARSGRLDAGMILSTTSALWVQTPSYLIWQMWWSRSRMVLRSFCQLRLRVTWELAVRGLVRQPVCWGQRCPGRTRVVQPLMPQCLGALIRSCRLRSRRGCRWCMGVGVAMWVVGVRSRGVGSVGTSEGHRFRCPGVGACAPCSAWCGAWSAVGAVAGFDNWFKVCVLYQARQ